MLTVTFSWLMQHWHYWIMLIIMPLLGFVGLCKFLFSTQITLILTSLKPSPNLISKITNKTSRKLWTQNLLESQKHKQAKHILQWPRVALQNTTIIQFHQNNLIGSFNNLFFLNLTTKSFIWECPTTKCCYWTLVIRQLNKPITTWVHGFSDQSETRK